MDEDTDDKDDTKRRTRNLTEKKRRDQFNSLVGDLSALISLDSRKMDKTSVLKNTVAFLRNHDACTEKAKLDDVSENWKPSFISNEEFTHVILEALESFIMVISLSGKILYVSEHISSLLGHNPLDLVNNNLVEMVYKDDQIHLYHQLQGYKPELEAWHDGMEQMEITFQYCVRRGQLKPEQKEVYEPVVFSGHFRRNTDYVETTGLGFQRDPDSRFLFVCTGRIAMPLHIRDVSLVDPQCSEFASRYSLEWKFIFLDHRAPSIIGYMPFEVLGTCGYDYYNFDEIDLVFAWHQELSEKGVSVSPYHRFLTKGHQWIWLQTNSYISYHQWTSKPEFVVCNHRVISYADLCKLPKPEKIETSDVSDVGSDDTVSALSDRSEHSFVDLQSRKRKSSPTNASDILQNMTLDYQRSPKMISSIKSCSGGSYIEDDGDLDVKPCTSVEITEWKGLSPGNQGSSASNHRESPRITISGPSTPSSSHRIQSRSPSLQRSNSSLQDLSLSHQDLSSSYQDLSPNNLSPIIQRRSLKKRSLSPNSQRSSPGNPRSSPINPRESPSNPRKSPSNPSASPSNPSGSPSNAIGSPSDEGRSPSNLSRSPTNLNISPSNQRLSPTIPSRSPSDHSPSPSNHSASPGLQEAMSVDGEMPSTSRQQSSISVVATFHPPRVSDQPRNTSPMQTQEPAHNMRTTIAQPSIVINEADQMALTAIEWITPKIHRHFHDSLLDEPAKLLDLMNISPDEHSSPTPASLDSIVDEALSSPFNNITIKDEELPELVPPIAGQRYLEPFQQMSLLESSRRQQTVARPGSLPMLPPVPVQMPVPMSMTGDQMQTQNALVQMNQGALWSRDDLLLHRKQEELQAMIMRQQEELRQVKEQLLMATLGILPPLVTAQGEYINPADIQLARMALPMQMPPALPPALPAPLPAQMQGQMPGQVPVQMPGQVPVQMPGQVSVQMTGQMPVQMPGQMAVQMPGHMGQMPGHMGQMPGQLPGQMPVQLPGQMPLQMPTQMQMQAPMMDYDATNNPALCYPPQHSYPPLHPSQSRMPQ